MSAQPAVAATGARAERPDRSRADLAADGRARRRPARDDRPHSRGQVRGRAGGGEARAGRAGADRRGARVERGDRPHRRRSARAPGGRARRASASTRIAAELGAAARPRAGQRPSVRVRRTTRSASRSPTRRTSTGSTRCGSRAATRSRCASPRARRSRPSSAGSCAPRRPSAAAARPSATTIVELEVLDEETTRTTSRSRTASPTRRSSASSTRSSSRRPRTAPATSTSSRRPTALVVRFRIDGVLHETQRIPKRSVDRRDDTPQGAREARHRRAPEAAGRPHLALRRPPPAGCSTSASPRCRRSRASRS